MNATLKWVLVGLGSLVLVGALLTAGFFIGRSAWGWSGGSPAYGYGYGGMMGGYGPGGMMGGGFGRGNFGPGGMMGGWNQNAPYGPGMMGGWGGDWADVELTISQDQAVQLAEDYLAAELPEASLAGDIFPMHGFYRMSILIDGQFAGMVLVNGESGEVFLHGWYDQPAGTDSN
ncbi:MAG: hypothetical protein HYZ26_00085 [Chloroflexi bacterium]|nr:hypothetical protein [Chloroflexota bacterium]